MVMQLIRIRPIGHVARKEEKADVRKQVSVEIPEGKKPFERPTRRWEDYKLDLKEIRRECMNWFNLSQNRDKWQAVVNTAMNVQV